MSIRKIDSSMDTVLFKAVEHFLPALSKLFYYNKMHASREFKIIHQQGRSDKTFEVGRMIELDQDCFSLLWLIDDLIESSNQTERMHSKSRRCCERELLSQCFYWRRTKAKTFNIDLKNKFSRLMKKLHATDLIGHEDKLENRNYHKVYLTSRGKKLLNELKGERAKALARIFVLGEINHHEFKRLAEEFDRMGNEAWRILLNEARELPTR